MSLSLPNLSPHITQFTLKITHSQRLLKADITAGHGDKDEENQPSLQQYSRFPFNL